MLTTRVFQPLFFVCRHETLVHMLSKAIPLQQANLINVNTVHANWLGDVSFIWSGEMFYIFGRNSSFWKCGFLQSAFSWCYALTSSDIQPSKHRWNLWSEILYLCLAGIFIGAGAWVIVAYLQSPFFSKGFFLLLLLLFFSRPQSVSYHDKWFPWKYVTRSRAVVGATKHIK